MTSFQSEQNVVKTMKYFRRTLIFSCLTPIYERNAKSNIKLREYKQLI